MGAGRVNPPRPVRGGGLTDISQMTDETNWFAPFMVAHKHIPAGRNGPVKSPQYLTEGSSLSLPPKRAHQLNATAFPPLPDDSCAYHLRSRLHETASSIARSPSEAIRKGIPLISRSYD